MIVVIRIVVFICNNNDYSSNNYSNNTDSTKQHLAGVSARDQSPWALWAACLGSRVSEEV